MMRGALVLGLVFVPAIALLACSSDNSTSSTAQAGAAGTVSAAGAPAASAGTAGTAGTTMGGSGGDTVVGNGGAAQAGAPPMQVDQCANGKKDGSETDVDCGNDCKQCALGQACVAFSDCASAHCVEGACQECAPGSTQCSGMKTATCTNGKWVDDAMDCPNGCNLNTGKCSP